MRIWAVVYDTSGSTVQGEGPVLVRSASVVRALDGPGSVTLTLAGWDARANSLFQPRRVVRVSVEQIDESVREVGAFVIEETKKADGNQKAFSVRGKDLLSLLKNTNTQLARIYNNQSVTAIVTALATLAGWTVGAEAALGSVNTNARFDGASVLQAIQSVLKDKGYHFRLNADTADQIEIGAFGVDSGSRAESVGRVTPGTEANADLLLIESIEETGASADVVNAILPLGAGDGDAAFTLEQSTRGGATTRTGPDGRTEYWLEDATSIAAYGRIERRVDFKTIAPVSNSSTDVENAANALEDAAVVWLDRNKNPKTQYRLTCRKPVSTLQVGDKLALNYVGEMVDRYGAVVELETIRGDYWIMNITESWGTGGGNVVLEVASVDELAQGVEGVIVGAIDSVQVNGIAIKPFPFVNSYVYRREMAANFNGNIPIDISNAVLDLLRVRVLFKTRPFRTTVTAAAAAASVTGTSAAGGGTTATSESQGEHRHRMFATAEDTAYPDGTYRQYAATNASSGGVPALLWFDAATSEDIYTESADGTHSHDVTITPHTHEITIPPHTHDLDYGIVDDTTYPATVRLFINGSDETVGLGGPWDASGNGADVELEVSDILKSGTLQQEHALSFRCDSGQGEIEVIVELYGIMQTIRVF